MAQLPETQRINPARTPADSLPPHRCEVALVHPQIAPNTGNVARLCVATGTHLNLIRPLGFVLSDRQLRRSAMDYWPRVKLRLHDDVDAFVTALTGRRLWLLDSSGHQSLWHTPFSDGDVLVFGSETSGLPPGLVRPEYEPIVRIPQVPGERCLNLATAVGTTLYECLRQVSTGPKSGIGLTVWLEKGPIA